MEIEYSADGSMAFYCGYKFRRDPNTGYYLCTKNTDIGRRERLHCFVWRTNNGDIPAGYHVHHVDENKRNNEPENLECIPRFDHLSFHANERVEKHYDDVIQNLIENAIPKAAEWHRSDEGRKWHKDNCGGILGRPATEHICQHCGKPYVSVDHGNNRFCSNNCRAAYRRKTGVDNETRRCDCCGAEYTANKYSARRFCSKECRDKFHTRKRNPVFREAASL